MGLGIGKYCERCGGQICYGTQILFQLKEDGYDHDICGECMLEYQKEEFDKKRKAGD